MTIQRITDYLDRNKALCAKRDQWNPLWQELSDILYPSRGGFTRPMLPGQEQMELYDTTPMQARRGLATAIDGLLKPSTSKWFWMKAKQDEINEDDAAKNWFDTVGERMWSAIYDPLARFIQHTGVVDNDVATFGLGYLWISENKNRNGLIFRSLLLNEVAIDENADGAVDTAFISRTWTGRQAYQRFGEKAGPKVMEALKESSKGKDKQFQFIQAVHPREEYDKRRRDNVNMPFANCIVSVADESIVEETGFEEFPLAVPRWEVTPGQVYPHGAGEMALPDSRTLQAMGHTLLVGGQRAVDPPTWVVDDAVLSAVRTFPGGLTVVDAQAVKDTGGKPIGQLEMGSNIPVGREMQNDYRQLVEAAFFKNVFNLPSPEQTGKMTAYEVSQRKEEFLRTMGPTLGQLENDYIGVIVRRVFGIMSRMSFDIKGQPLPGAPFPPPPDILAGADAMFEFMSPIQQAQKQIEAHSLMAALQMVGPVIQLKMESADNINADAIVRDIPDMFSTKHDWIVSKDDVAAIRAQRAKAQQAAQTLQGGQQVADVVKTVADAHHATARGNAANADATQQQVPA